jgi:hypothetical protein
MLIVVERFVDAELHQELDRASNRQWANRLDGLNRVLEDPEARQLHLGLLPPALPEKDPMYEHHVRGLELKLLSAGPRALTTSEKRELLLSADSIRRLRPETGGKENPPAAVPRTAVSV